MSSIKNTQIDGDVSVGRNVSIGGNTTIQGNGHIKGGFKVDGWLDAKNIKGANKGIFTTVEKLREAYPLPHDGWWAIVGRSLPSPIYVADGGVWVATGGSGGNPTVDSEQHNNNIAKLQADISENSNKIKALEVQSTTQRDSVNQTHEAVVKAQQTAENAKKAASDVNAELTTIKDSKGKANGIAPLDEEGKVSSAHLPSYVDDVIEFDSCLDSLTAQQQATDKSSKDEHTKVVYNRAKNKFVLAVASDEDSTTTYYGDWSGADNYGTASKDGRTPASGKVYIDSSDNITYRWSGTKLAPIGSDLALGYTSSTAFPGYDGKQLQDDMTDVKKRVSTLESSNSNTATQINARGVINVNKLLGQENGDMTFSVALSKIDELPNKADYQIAGIVLTFNTPNNGWQSKQWVNTEAWNKEGNWKDFGTNGSNIGNILNVNTICSDVEYTLSTAIKAVQNLEKQSGFKYFKSGVVLTFKTADNDSNGAPVWSTFQFTREVPDINPADLKPWVAFGGGGTAKVEVSDTPEQNGEKAFSTGGAYSKIPTNIKLNTETEGVVKLQLVNEADEGVGDEQQFTVGTSGNTSGTTIAIAFKENPLYGKAGGSFICHAAIMSITKAGSQETSNSITNVQFVDRTTKKVVATFDTKKPSSSTLEDYSFVFDLSSLYVNAGQGSLQMQVVDDGGNTARKNLSVTSVDVTCVSAQTLNYTKDTSLEVGGKPKNILMFSYPNNSSDKGVKTTIEIYRDGSWKTLATPIITDTYSHTVNIDPTGLSHGAYPIRIQGQDVSSGVKGNVLYTAVMVIQQDSSLDDYDKPIVVARWSDNSDGKKKLYSTISFDVAVYQRSTSRPEATVTLTNVAGGKVETVTKQIMVREKTFTISKRLVSYAENDQLTFDVTCGASSLVEPYKIIISGTLLPISETEGALFKINMSERSNADSDKTITTQTTDGQKIDIAVKGSNYSTNGFVKDSFGTSSYGTTDDNGRMALRIAEDVSAVCSYHPFASNSIETNGMALSFTVMTKNVADNHTHIIKCMGEKLGFILTGEELILATNGSLTDAATTAIVPYVNNKVTRFDIVIEPSAIAPYSGIGVIKIFRNGDEAGAVAYKAGELTNHYTPISFDGHKADLYLYDITVWNTYYNFIQACNNYIVGLTDTAAMFNEYEENDVLASVTAEGTTKERPTMQKCLDAGLMVCAICKNPDTEDIAANYPDYLEAKDGDKKTKQIVDWYCYFPDRPWQDCKIIGISQTNQGTTSSWRPIKNKKGKMKRAIVTLLHTREEIAAMFPGNSEALAKYDKCVSMAAKHRVQIVDGGNFTKIFTIKVDYSDSCGAHNGAMMELMNDTQIALGKAYMTPAQIYNEGEYEIHTSIDSVPCALFRTDSKMNHNDAENPTKAYFHAKANFNADKGDADFFGFKGVNGYSKKCLNYGDFIELVAAQNQTLTVFKSQVLADTTQLIAGNIYVLSEYCGDKHIVIENDGKGTMREVQAVEKPVAVDKTLAEVLTDDVKNYTWQNVYKTSDNHYVQYQGGNWIDTTGNMTFNKATKKWSVTGRVVNPTECYEYLKYDSLCWGQGVNSLDDMMRIDPAIGAPIWMSYYETRYPDDDNLEALYKAGKKVPYNLYKWLVFSQQCNQHQTEANGNITLGDVSVPGTKENRLKKWQQEVHKHANPYSLCCYTIASDYKAAVDQRSKNMMIAFYLEPDGTIRAYFNHWYDGDCVDGSDNDCGLTIPWDMDAVTSHLYQGWDSVTFVQTYAAPNLWIDDSGTTTITLHDVADAMRKAERNNRKVFSADGCYHYWITKRLSKWAKVTSSFDGERKYIQSSTSAANYFYALHGLRLEDLPDYQRKRFKLRDGFYKVGDLYTAPFKARMMGAISIKITAAQDGFFGLGEDRADTVTDSCYLKAGESYTLRTNDAQESGKMIYVFGADKLGVLDISACTPKQEAFDISTCTLLKELIIGNKTYTPAYTTGILSSLELPSMPFLQKIDVQGTKLLSLRASGCPRLKTVLAKGSTLRAFTPAEACPLEVAEFPASMTDIVFVNMPNVTYPNGGLTYEGLSKVSTIKISGCAYIDRIQVLEDVIAAGATISTVSIQNIECTKKDTALTAMKAMGTRGIGSEQKTLCDGISGVWTLNKYIEEEVLASLQGYYPNLTIHQSQYTMIVFDDTIDDPANISNLDNNTGKQFDNEFVASGHVTKIRKNLIPVRGKLNTERGVWEGVKISEENYHNLANGEEFDYTDKAANGYDVMMRCPTLWYKGINDFKNQKKYIAWSSLEDKPLSSAKKTTRKTLSDILLKANTGVMSESISENESTLGSAGVLADVLNVNTYKIDVEGMKQVRYPGMNNSTIGACFVNADGLIISKYNMTIGNTLFDFVDGDYIFIEVPHGAKSFIFSSRNTNAELEAIAVDSSEVEAIEPDWVRSEEWLGGVYQASVDSLLRLRSVSDAPVRSGDGEDETSPEWQYDENGEPKNMPVNTIHYTGKDFQNIAHRRGKGYQLFDYEMSKLMAILWFSLNGTRDAQLVCGYGRSSIGTTTGFRDDIGNTDSKRNDDEYNKCLGFESFFGCLWEFMDYVAINVPTYEQFMKDKCVPADTYPLDTVWHIYDPLTKTERTIQGLNIDNYCIARTKHGRYCDVIVSKCNSDNIRSAFNYTDEYHHSQDRGVFIIRSGGQARAYGGLVFANSRYTSSRSFSDTGSRLAFRGKIEISE